MRFTVFADELRSADSAQIDSADLAQQLDYLIAPVVVGGLQLPLGQTPQVSAAGLTAGSCLGIEPREEVVGN